jgi:hypothetical protein
VSFLETPNFALAIGQLPNTLSRPRGHNIAPPVRTK